MAKRRVDPTKVLALLTSADPEVRGRYAAVARRLQISRSRVSQIVEAAGGPEVLGLVDRHEQAVTLLQQGVSREDVAAITGLKVGYVRRLSFNEGIMVCETPGCDNPREPWHRLCEDCRKGRVAERMRKYRDGLKEKPSGLSD